VGVEGPIEITKPLPPIPPTASNNDPVCDGGSLQLFATHTLTDVIYNWSGPLGFTSTQQNPVIDPAYLIHSGVYSVTATRLACESAPVTTTVVIYPIPNIGGITFTNPTTCKGTDGTITLSGLTPGLTFVVRYIYNGATVTTTVVADVAGKIALTGLASGGYAGITVQSFTCVSNVVGPVSLIDPGPPAVPELWNNGPICSGKTLLLKSKDDNIGYVYEWTGPNGFTSRIKEPVIDVATSADSGLYTLTIRYRNCPSVATMNVVIYPPVVLKNVTPSQMIPIGSKIQLYASGATFYTWTPNGGTLDVADIDSPIANTEEAITYMVKGRDEHGCEDSAFVTVTIDYNIEIFIPNAFTPNNDGNNDEFRIGNLKYDRLVDFTVYNRWGGEVYHNNYNIKKGWDGTYNGVPQDMGVYHYSVTLGTPDGKLKYYKGDVTLIR
jgi:gliding motility-associated-like protein